MFSTAVGSPTFDVVDGRVMRQPFRDSTFGRHHVHVYIALAVETER
jgi:hypothetical protein